MTLALDLDLDIMKTYPHTKNEVCRSSHSKVICRARTGTTPTFSLLLYDLDLDLDPMTLG